MSNLKIEHPTAVEEHTGLGDTTAELRPAAKCKVDSVARTTPWPCGLGYPHEATNTTPEPESQNTAIAKLEQKHDFNVRDEAKRLETLTAQERVSWAMETFDSNIVMSSSFGAQSAVSLHMLTQQRPDLPVILVDTGYLFKETYDFIDQLTEQMDLNLKVYRNEMSPAWQEAKFGKLWEQGIEGIDRYNIMNKVEPMSQALGDLQVEAIFGGLRRKQSSSRENIPVLVSQRGRIKIHPIIDWTDKDVYLYLNEHNLPYHPLWAEGYVSIGDWHTTRKLTEGMTAEETRFFGLKRECGLNQDLDFQI